MASSRAWSESGFQRRRSPWAMRDASARSIAATYLSVRAPGPPGNPGRVVPVLLRRGGLVLLEPGLRAAAAAAVRPDPVHVLPDAEGAGQLQHPARGLPGRA